MTNQPLISIIIPCYKVEQYLDACMETVISQTYKDLEILLVDDGSPDNTGALCDAWAKKDSRIRVIHKENGGLSSARNAGIEEAKGEYIMFLDSDDTLHREICSHLYHCLEENGAAIAICDLAHVFPGEDADFNVSQEVKTLSAPDAIRDLWYQKNFLPSACAKLYKREVLATLRFTQGLLYEDIDLMHLLFWQAKKVVYTPSKLYGYSHREDSITTKKFSVRDLDILTVAEKLLAFAREQDTVLLDAAKSYAVVAALRVELNAPHTEGLKRGREKAREMLSRYGKQVLKDPNIRKKTRYGLILYFYCRPLMSVIYQRINRWK